MVVVVVVTGSASEGLGHFLGVGEGIMQRRGSS